MRHKNKPKTSNLKKFVYRKKLNSKTSSTLTPLQTLEVCICSSFKSCIVSNFEIDEL